MKPHFKRFLEIMKYCFVTLICKPLTSGAVVPFRVPSIGHIDFLEKD